MSIMAVLKEIGDERSRQIHKEGWTAAHDDAHTDSELVRAAACYALPFPYRRMAAWFPEGSSIGSYIPEQWPWDVDWWKSIDGYVGRRRDLIKAAALIVAEIERLDRAEGSAPTVPALTGESK
jgi:hypothetical protein